MRCCVRRRAGEMSAVGPAQDRDVKRVHVFLVRGALSPTNNDMLADDKNCRMSTRRS